MRVAAATASVLAALVACNAIAGIHGATLEEDAGDSSAVDSGSGDDASDACPPGSDFATDPDNCGRCGRTCFGKTCASGICSPETLVGHDLGDTIYQLAIDDRALYWAAPLVNYVQSVPKAGGPLAALAPTDDDPAGIAVGGGDVYWLQLFSGRIWSVPVEGGSRTTVATNVPVDTALAAADDASLYFTNHNGTTGFIGKLPFGGGTITTLASQPDSILIAIDDASVFWTADGALYRVAKQGGKPAQILDGSHHVGAIAVDEASVYWITIDPAPGSVLSVPKSGGQARPLVQGQGTLASIAVDAARVYWASLTSQTIASASKADGSDVRILADAVRGADGGTSVETGMLVVDESFVYWFGEGNKLFRTPK